MIRQKDPGKLKRKYRYFDFLVSWKHARESNGTLKGESNDAIQSQNYFSLTSNHITRWCICRSKVYKSLLPFSIVFILYLLLYSNSVSQINEWMVKEKAANVTINQSSSVLIFTLLPPQEEPKAVSMEDWLGLRERSVLIKRKLHLEQTCIKFNFTESIDKNQHMKTNPLLNKFVNHKNFVISQSEKLLGCLINKVASSSLVYTFLNLKGIQTNSLTSPHSRLTEITPKDAAEFSAASSSYYKFMFVRDPLARLLSVYFNKALSTKIKAIEKFGPDVKRKGREMIDLYKRNRTSFNYDLEKSENATMPNMEEFLEFILVSSMEGQGFASHWVPYWKRCCPCLFNYDVIGKLETGNDDFTYLWKRTGIDAKVPMLSVNLDPKSEAARKDKQKLGEMLHKVPREVLVEIYRIYQFDYELFDYNFDDTLKLAGYPPLTESERHLFNFHEVMERMMDTK